MMKTIKLLLKLTASLLVFFGLASCNKEDEELPESKVMKELVDYVDSHEEVIQRN